MSMLQVLEESEPRPTSIETLTGASASECEVIYNDGKPSEFIVVKQLPVKKFPALLSAQDDECRMIELYADKPSGWADTLDLDSFERLAKEGERLNADFFSRWVQRRLARSEKLIPGFSQKLMDAAKSASPTGSPK